MSEPAAESPSAQLREAAKWLIASFGAVAAVVAAGIQFGNVGEVGGSDLIWALTGAGAALLGVGVAMYSVARLLVPRARSITDLARAEASDPARKYILANPEILQGFSSIETLKQTREEDRTLFHSALHAWRRDPSEEKANVVKTAAALRAPSDEIASEVVLWANYHTLRHDFDRAMKRWVLPGIAIAAIGLTVFAIEIASGSDPTAGDPSVRPELLSHRNRADYAAQLAEQR